MCGVPHAVQVPRNDKFFLTIKATANCFNKACNTSKKRRVSKNRILRSGESHHKDGRYAFKHTEQFIYSWKP
ncbi:integrase DNA-binding domain-containing protein [Agathobaculum sp. TL06]